MRDLWRLLRRSVRSYHSETRSPQTIAAKGPHGWGGPSRMHPEDARSMRTGADTCEAVRGAKQRVGV